VAFKTKERATGFGWIPLMGTGDVAFKTKERATGFGPAMSAWKADALPLGDARWCGKNYIINFY
jgi:hypothetical protein